MSELQPVATLNIFREGDLWTVTSDTLKGLIVHGHSLAEVLARVPVAGSDLWEVMTEDARETEKMKAFRPVFSS
jgi:hypothetical protein